MPWFDTFMEVYEDLIGQSSFQLTCGELAYTYCIRKGIIEGSCYIQPGLNRIITDHEMPWWRVVKLGYDLGQEVIVPRDNVEISAHVGHYLGAPSMCVRWEDGKLRLKVPKDSLALYKNEVFEFL